MAVKVPPESYHEMTSGLFPAWAADDNSGSASGTTLVAAPGSGFAIMVHKIMGINRSTTAGTLTMEDGGAQISGFPILYMASEGGVVIDDAGILLTENQALTYTTVLADNHSVAVKYSTVRVS